MNEKTKMLIQSSYLYGGNALYIETLFEQYCIDPHSISEMWKEYFDDLYTGKKPVFQPAEYQLTANHFSESTQSNCLAGQFSCQPVAQAIWCKNRCGCT